MALEITFGRQPTAAEQALQQAQIDAFWMNIKFAFLNTVMLVKEAAEATVALEAATDADVEETICDLGLLKVQVMKLSAEQAASIGQEDADGDIVDSIKINRIEVFGMGMRFTRVSAHAAKPGASWSESLKFWKKEWFQSLLFWKKDDQQSAATPTDSATSADGETGVAAADAAAPSKTWRERLSFWNHSWFQSLYFWRYQWFKNLKFWGKDEEVAVAKEAAPADESFEAVINNLKVWGQSEKVAQTEESLEALIDTALSNINLDVAQPTANLADASAAMQVADENIVQATVTTEQAIASVSNAATAIEAQTALQRALLEAMPNGVGDITSTLVAAGQASAADKPADNS